MIKEFSMHKKTINELKDAINSNKKMIVSTLWSDHKDYKKIEKLLLKNGFEIQYKRPVFYKKVSAPNLSELTFKKNNTLIKKMYFDFLKKTKDLDYKDDKKNPQKSFKSIISKNNEWNLCVYKDKDLIGFFTVTYDDEDNYGTLLLIYVKDKFRGKNYSIEMMKKAEELFKKEGIKEWYESTHETNIPMIKIFTKYGFKHKRDLIFFIRK